MKIPFLSRLFADNAKNKYNEIEVLFYKEARHDGEHGRIVVSHKKQRLNHVEVPFVLRGVTTPPPLTAGLVVDLWSAGESQGYVLHHIVQYGTDAEVVGKNIQTGPAADTSSMEALPAHLRNMADDMLNGDFDRMKIPAVQRHVAADNVTHNLSTGELMAGASASVFNTQVPSSLVKHTPRKASVYAPAPRIGTDYFKSLDGVHPELAEETMK